MDQQSQFIEDVGVYFEAQGVPRMAGRLLAWLLICDPPEQTMSDMVARLQVSKGSASAMLRMLTQSQLVERISRPGIRADFYRVAPDFGEKIMNSATQKFSLFRIITERGLKLLEDAPAGQRERLEDLHSIYAYLENRFPTIAQEWREERAKDNDKR